MRHNFLGNNGLINAKLEIYNEKNYEIIVKHAFQINSQYHNLHLGRVYISHNRKIFRICLYKKEVCLGELRYLNMTYKLHNLKMQFQANSVV